MPPIVPRQTSAGNPAPEPDIALAPVDAPQPTPQDRLETEPNYDSRYLALRGQAADDALMREFMDKTAPETAQPAPQAAGAAIKAEPVSAGQPEPKPAGTPKKPGFNELFTAAMQVSGSPAQRALVGGVLDAVRSTAATIDDIALKLEDWTGLSEKLGLVEPMGLSDLVKGKKPGDRFRKLKDVVPDVGKSQSMSEEVVRGITRFVAGFLPAKRVVGALGVTGQVSKPLIAGAVTDLLVWEGDEQRLSDLIQSVPALQNPVTEYLASNENDSRLKGKFKIALEGMGLGLATDALFSGLRALKAKKAAAGFVQDAITKDPEAAVKAVQQLGPDEMLRPVTEAQIAKRLGDPNAPIVSRVARRISKEAVDEFGADVSNVFATMKRAEDKAIEAGADVAQGLAKGAKAKTDRIFVNLNRINAPEDVQAALKAMAEMDAPHINALRGGEKQSFAVMEQLAEASGMTVEELVKRRGRPLTLGETLAARNLWAASGEQLVELAKTAAKTSAPEDVFAFRKAMAVHYAIQGEIVAERTAQARALTSWRIAAKGGRERMKAIENLLEQSGGNDLSMNMAAKIAMLDSPEAVSMFVRKAQHATTLEVLQEYFVTGLLWSPKTQFVNATSNSLTALWAIPERLTAAGVSQTIGSGDIHVREALSLAWGQMKGTRDGLKLFWKTLKTGMPSGSLKIELPRRPAISAEGMNLTGPAGHVADFLGNVQRGGTRLLMAADEFFKAVAYRGELHAQAYRTAVGEGLTGPEAARRIADIVANPPENLRMAASNFADVQTFTNELGAAGQAVSRGINKVPGLRFVVPFIRTPTNIFKYGFHRTPLAPFMGHIKQEIAAGGVRADLARAKVALGTAAMFTVADYVTEGRITGGGPSDPNLKAARRRQGIPDYGIKVGDTWYRYNRIEPLGFMMGMSADVSEILMHVDETEGEQIVLAGTMAFAKNMTSKTYLQGLSSLLETIDDPERYGPQFVSSLAGGFIPLSSLMRNIATTADTTRRETKTAVGDPDVEGFRESLPDPLAEFAQRMVNEVKARTPGFGADLPPKRDLWGEPIDVTSGKGMAYDFVSPIAASEEKPDAVDQMILDNRISVGMPNRIIDGVRLTNAEYSQYTELAGKTAKQRLDQMQASGVFDNLSDGPDGMKANLVKKVVMQAREEAQARMIGNEEDLRQRVFDRRRERGNVLREGGALR